MRRRFLWGAATSSAQIEGDLAGRGRSIWDDFAVRPGAVADGSTPAVAIEHVDRFADDVALMADLGLDAYRFSIAWPRVVPDGRGAVSETGLAFYSDLVDALVAAGIEPVVTLYHWDLPSALQESGGWAERDTALRFADYATIIAEALGDRVRHWVTVNEPWCSSMLGHASGVHAPGIVHPPTAVAAAHHLLLAHGLGTLAVRAVVGDGHEVSLSLNPYPVVAAGDGDDDRDAARRVDGVANRLWYDAVLRGEYPADVLEDFSAVSDLSHIVDGDLDVIAQPLDALGVNYYRRYHVRHAPGASGSPPYSAWPGSPDVELVDPGVATTALGWAIEPDGLYETLTSVADAYEVPPLYVHENGAAFDDVATRRGDVDDADREAFLRSHIDALQRAVDDGVDVRGYFVWSLFDNFEWAEGYRIRFGIVHVDYDTQFRTIKRSGRWYAEHIAACRARR